MPPPEKSSYLSLPSHPIFSVKSSSAKDLQASDLRTHAEIGEYSNSAQLQAPDKMNVMVVRGSDLIVAVGTEIRITTWGESLPTGVSAPTYKTLTTPNIDFVIESLSLSPSGKLLSVAGASQLAVVVLPRPAYSRLVSDAVDCKSIRVGQYYHANLGSSPIVKVEWHPWGEGGSSLLVMTMDGALREYDLAVDAEEPQQTLSFIPKKARRTGYKAVDEASEQVTSFCLGKGKADWGPLTLYALAKSGDVYAICPFLPTNAAVPDGYIQTLECFVSAKRAAFTAPGASSRPTLESTIYDHQYKYVRALLKQVPPPPSSASRIQPRTIHLHPPTSINQNPMRQGPFLLQPAPLDLGIIESTASDIAYILAGDEDSDEDTEPLGVVVIVFSDGRVDMCLDTEKIEAQFDILQTYWETSDELPLPCFTIYECIDLGISSRLEECLALPLLAGNTPRIHLDPLYGDLVYIPHAFGVHSLDMSGWLGSLTQAMQADEETDKRKASAFLNAVKNAEGTEVRELINTLDPSTRSSAPIVAMSVMSNSHVAYTLFGLTASYELVTYDLNLRITGSASQTQLSSLTTTPLANKEPKEHPEMGYVSLLEKEPWKLPSLQSIGTRLALPSSSQNQEVTADSLRFFGKNAETAQQKMRDLGSASNTVLERAAMQGFELKRQIMALRTLVQKVDSMRERQAPIAIQRAKEVEDQQHALSERIDKMLQRLMDNYSSTLSEFEVKWFAELADMEHDVVGAGDGTGLSSRTAAVLHRFSMLKKDIAQLKEQSAAKPAPSKLGSIQLRGIERRLATEQDILEEGKRKMDDLTTMLALHTLTP